MSSLSTFRAVRKPKHDRKRRKTCYSAARWSTSRLPGASQLAARDSCDTTVAGGGQGHLARCNRSDLHSVQRGLFQLRRCFKPNSRRRALHGLRFPLTKRLTENIRYHILLQDGGSEPPPTGKQGYIFGIGIAGLVQIRMSTSSVLQQQGHMGASWPCSAARRRA